jgi:hypothetical protein
MSTDKVSQYLQLLSKQLKPHSTEGDKNILESLDSLWTSMSEDERTRTEASRKVLISYFESRE